MNIVEDPQSAGLIHLFSIFPLVFKPSIKSLSFSEVRNVDASGSIKNVKNENKDGNTNILYELYFYNDYNCNRLIWGAASSCCKMVIYFFARLFYNNGIIIEHPGRRAIIVVHSLYI